MKETMLDFGDLTLTGPEVTLRPLREDDAGALAKATAESRDTYLYSAVPKAIDGTNRYIQSALQQRERGERFPFVICWQGRIVGSTSYSDYQPWHWAEGSPLQRTSTPDVLEIGYTWLAASAQRTRCNSEAKYLLLRHAFETWNVYRVCLRTDERNSRSRNAIERLGAKFEGVRRGDKPGEDGTIRNSAFYSITSEEWPIAKKRFVSLEIET